METITINTEFIKLDQFLKWIGAVDTGADAKNVIAEGIVKVNGNVEIKRGKKLRSGDTVEIEGKIFKIG
ncbi:MAG: S4 domain-containing protein YaaA [Clostridia bacterium]|nr:S4 domain-containing protein YaaA [Clostridia bacterium]